MSNLLYDKVIIMLLFSINVFVLAFTQSSHFILILVRLFISIILIKEAEINKISYVLLR